LAVILRERGFDATHVYEAERSGMSDADQLDYAVQQERAILTHNSKDFVPLSIEYFFNERPHNGVILSPQIEKGELVRRTLNLLYALSAEEIANTVRHLADYK
jgi:predicted nuclease of predicted toxin-antitoxin system